MRNLLKFFGTLIMPSHLTTVLWGTEEITVTSDGQTVIRRVLQYGSLEVEERYFPEHGKLIRMTEGWTQTFQEQKEAR